MREFKIRIHLDGVAQLFDRLIILASHIEPPTQAEIRADGEWILISCPVDLVETVTGPTHGDQVKRVSLVGGSVAGIEFDGALESARRACPVPVVVKSDGGQRSLRFG